MKFFACLTLLSLRACADDHVGPVRDEVGLLSVLVSLLLDTT